ncbi:MAG: hypothetical protein M0R80_09700 [Proteobacteria bacterium]|jgi:hypothetical protein|nr:hypothetical protein [Pseudomonadota bacterium]
MRAVHVKLEESDFNKLDQLGMCKSDAIRRIIHHILEHDSSYVDTSVVSGDLRDNISMLEKSIARLRQQRSIIDHEILNLDTRLASLQQYRVMVESRHNELKMWERLCEIGNVIDNAIVIYGFDPEKILEENEAEIKEMETINPGWTLTSHLEMRKKMMSAWGS